MGHACSGRRGTPDHDRVAGAVVLVQDHQVFDRLAHLGDVTDEHDQPASATHTAARLPQNRPGVEEVAIRIVLTIGADPVTVLTVL